MRTLNNNRIGRQMRERAFRLPGIMSMKKHCAIIAALVLALLPVTAAQAALEIEVITAYNFVVDSNVLTPATYAPNAAMIGAEFCNTDTTALTDVRAYVGNYGTGRGDISGDTPGVYPKRYSNTFSGEHDHLYRATDGGYYSLTHEGGSAGSGDAFRYMKEIPGGECKVQYWLVSYPKTSDDEKEATSPLSPEESVTGGDIGPEDDLWLEYDIWADATGQATTVWATRKATMRNEISAMANKIWPNGDNKVPTEYKEAIDAYLGWDTATPSGTTDTYPGDLAIAQGVWYDFGVVGAGFDNDGDLVPDYNAWAQPIGDAGAYDPGCFRMISTEAYVLLKRQDGSIDIFDYKDRLYFENMPSNTGAVGLVFYNFTALDGKCTAGLSPYQEVASGYDNEKFNGDYGVGTPPLQSIDPSGQIPVNKEGTANITVPEIADTWSDITYDITYSNDSGDSNDPNYDANLVLGIGDPDIGMPLVVRDSIPEGTSYKIDSAAFSSLPTGLTTGQILFSYDNGVTWTATEPATEFTDANDGTKKYNTSVTDIQWWLNEELPPTTDGSTTVVVSFEAGIPYGYAGSSVVCNTGELGFGTGPAFADDTYCTLVSGPNSLEGTVFKDLDIDGIYNNADTVLDNIHVTLYTDLGVAVIDGLLDLNGDGAISAEDDGEFGGYTVVDGWIDLNGDGDTGADATGDPNTGADAADDGNIGLDNSWEVIDGKINVNVANTVVDADDDGRIWDGIFDVDDLLVGEIDSGAVTTGEYNFANLPDGVYFVQVDTEDTDLFVGAAPTTSTLHTVRLDIVQGDGNDTTPVNSTDNDFGFIEPLKVTKAVTSTGSPYGDEEEITYTLTVENQLPAAGSNVNGQCVYTLFPSDSPDVSSAWTEIHNVYAIDGNYALATISSQNDTEQWFKFTAPAGAGSIVDVQVVMYDPVLRADSGTVLAQNISAQISKADPPGNFAQAVDSGEIPVSTIIGSVNYAFTGLYGDRTSEIWEWSEIGDLQLELTTHKAGDTIYLEIDAVALQITSSDPCPAGNDNTITDIRLQDSYEKAKLTYVSSTPTRNSEDISDATFNTLIWNNVGPLSPGTSTEVTVVLRGDNDTAATLADVENTAFVAAGEATFGDGDPANESTSTAYVDIEPAINITGNLFVDIGGDGWNTTSPYGDDPLNDTYLAGQTMELWACIETDTGIIQTGMDGSECVTSTLSWAVVSTTTTASNGSYSFNGVTEGYYYVKAPADPYGGIINAAPSDVRNPTTTSGDLDQWWFNPSNSDGLNGVAVDTFLVVGGSGTFEDSTNIDFGYTTNGAVSGYIWEDIDGDGVWDTGEPPLSGISVELIDCDSAGTSACGDDAGETSISIPTTADGYYEFLGLINNGNYRINVLTLLEGEGGATGDLASGTWDQTQETADGEAVAPGNDATIDEYIDFQAAAGQVLFNRDFGYQEEGTRSIDGTVYYDWGGDGAQDLGDIGVSGVTVSLYTDENGDGVIDPTTDILVGTVTTEADGDYIFNGTTLAEFPNGLPPGEFLVVVDETYADLDLYEQIEDPDVAVGGGVCVGTQCDGDGKADVTSGNQENIDFGYQPQGPNSMSGQIWEDLDGEGDKDGGQEIGIPDVSVTLQWTSDGGTTWYDIRTTTGSDGTTDVDGDGTVDLPGSYYFGDLPDGSYRVVVSENDDELPLDGSGESYTPTTGTDDASERYFQQALSGGTDSANNDFGFTLLGAIGDQVFWDVNGDGDLDQGEPGIENVTVNLYTFTDTNGDGKYDNGEPLSALVDSDVTDADGYYLFSGLTAGNYVVEVDRGTDPDETNNPLTSDPDSDGVPCDGYVVGSEACDGLHGVPIGSTQYLNADFGYKPENVLGDTIWMDMNQDGVQDDGELGLVGVTVELQSAGCTAGVDCPTAVTDADGYYVFTDLVPGTVYTVVVDDTTLPAGLDSTYDFDGGTTSPDHTVALSAWESGDTNLDIDFGYFYTGTNDLSGTVCLDDASEDGVCNGANPSGVDTANGESAYAQVAVNLYRWNDSTTTGTPGTIDPGEEQYLGSTLTDANGDYSFNDLADGTYWVTSGAPDEYLALTATTDTDSQIPNAEKISINSAADGSTTGASERTVLDGTVGEGVGLDFAFKEIYSFDYGDLPESYGTLRDDNGARHIDTGDNDLFIGTAPDTEADGIPDAAANGDDGSNIDDEGYGAGSGSGIIADPSTWTEGTGGGTVEVELTGSGYLVAWIDFDGDGSFGTYGETVISAYVDSTVDASPEFTFDIPSGTFDSSEGYARFRLFPEKPVIPELAYLGTADNGEVEDVQFSFTTSSGSIGNRVWLDENGDGKQDAGESGIPNIEVYLYDCGGDGNCTTESDNNLIKTVTTDAHGEYIFTDLAAGDWVVRTVKRAEDSGTTTLTTGIQQTYDEDDTNPLAIATGNMSVVTLAPGEEHLTADFGYNWVAPVVTDTPGASDTGAIGDRIWSDADGQGDQDAEEPGISGVNVYLLFDLNGDGIYGGAGDGTDTDGDGIYGGPGDAGAVTETTDAAGYYIFTDVNVKVDNADRDLGVGSYVVYVDDMSLPTTTTWSQTGDPDLDNDNKTTSAVLLGPGDVYLQADFGYQPTNNGSISGTVYLDVDADACSIVSGVNCGDSGDNVLNGSDKGFPGVTVALKDGSGNIIATTITDTSGNYTFSGVPYDDDGEIYTVAVTDTRHVLGEVKQSGDPDSILDQEYQVTLITGTTSITDVNYGYTPEGHTSGEGFIGDTIFLDSDQSGSYDLGEGMESVSVSLYKDGALVAVTKTDENGWYQFGNLDPAETDYEVRVKTTTIPNTDLTLYNSVDPENDDNSRSAVNLEAASGQDLLRDFGYDKASGDNSLAGIIWNDTDANGTLTDGTSGTSDEQAAGIGGVIVNLLDSDGNIVGSTTTISSPADLDNDGYEEPVGSYLFKELPDGDYTIEVTDTDDILKGYWLSDGPDDGVDNNSQVPSYSVNVSGGQDNSTGDFGYYLEDTSFGGSLWNDTNGDGIKDSGEPPLVYYQVVLTVTYPDNGATTTMTVMTDQNGDYRFDNVMLDEDYNAADGQPTYSISVPDTGELVSTHTATTDDENIADGVVTADNLADNPAGETVSGLVKGEQDDFTRDFGFVGGASIGDRVWLDLDRDGTDNEGIQNIGDPGLSGVTVKLYRDDGDGNFEPGTGVGEDGDPILTTVTDGNGNYSFDGLPPGDYWVDVDYPTDLTETTAGQGSDEALDSDLAAGAGGSLITVIADQVIDDLDFGLVGTSPLLGDTIWYDANGNDIQDAGESGLGGIDVIIHPCGNDSICGNTDDLCGIDGICGGVNAIDDTSDFSVTTDSAGHYLQSVSAGVYEVSVDVTDLPAGMNTTPTNGSATREYNVPDNADILYADFGFDGGTEYTIGNQVWEDENGNGVKDTGETNGIAGVTVDLYRDGISVATTTTAADGTYEFKVVQTGVDYEVRVTDQDNILDGRTLTTGTASTDNNSQADPLTISNLTTDITYADFGYQSLSIGDFIWHDLNGDGIQDAGESGLNGVEVELYLDSDGDGLWDAPGDGASDDDEVLIRTTTTVDGRYDFTGIPAGNYFVKLPDSNFDTDTNGPLENFNAVEPGQGSDSSLDSDGDKTTHLAVVELKDTSDYKVDFGFRYEPADALYSIGDLVWYDTSEDGIPDSSEVGAQGITVTLYADTNGNGQLDSEDLLLQTTTTSDGTVDIDGDGVTTDDPIGSYYFGENPLTGTPGLSAGDYFVVIGEGDDLGGLSLTTGSTNPRAVTIDGADVTDADFGLAPVIATYAVVSSFKAYVNGDNQTVLEWKTASEIGTIGFILERLNEQSGKYQAITKQLLPGMLSPPHGGTYRYVDKTAQRGRSYTYRVVEVAANDQGVVSGPYTVQANELLPLNNRMFADGPEGYALTHQEFSGQQLKRFAARSESALELAAQQESKTGDILKIPVSKNGLVYLTSADLATASGLSEDQIIQYLQAKECLVTLAEVSVPVIAADTGSGLWFYGQAPDRNDIAENIYLLELGVEGVKMESTPGGAEEIVESEQSFLAHVQLEENIQPLYFYNLSNPIDDFWAWDYLFASGGDAELNHTVDLPHVTGEGTATVTVDLVGVVDSNSGQASPYKVTVFLNGNSIGAAAEWSEKGDYRFSAEVAAELLQEGANDVRIVSHLNSGVSYSLIFLDSIDVEYQSRYEAVNGELLLTNADYDRVTVTGFSSSNVLAMDITDPSATQRVRILPDKNKAGEYTVTILTEPGHKYFVTENVSESVAGDITVDSPSQLRSADNRADYLIITSLDLMESAETLADYRTNEGMIVTLVDVEDIWDEFAHGLAAPEAIHDFLLYVYENWTQVPGYVALIGDGSYDYKDYLGYGASQLPSMLVSTPDGYYPSDNAFADVIGDDGVPEFSIGRIPVVDDTELNSYIDKIIDYEQSLLNESRVMTLVTDGSDPSAGDFISSTDQVAALIPEYFSINQLDVDSTSYSEVTSGIDSALQQGVNILHYAGHSSWVGYGTNSSLMSSSGIESMADLDSPMLMVSMACSSGSFGYPPMNSVGESAVLQPNGAAVGFFGATGLSRNYLADILAEGFYSSLLDSKGDRLGDAIVQAKQHYFNVKQGEDRYTLDIYNLLGDPALHAPTIQ
ncbi:hypothetical protein KKHLCK_14480 [Candidatus Electrothrix laxa]